MALKGKTVWLPQSPWCFTCFSLACEVACVYFEGVWLRTVAQHKRKHDLWHLDRNTFELLSSILDLSLEVCMFSLYFAILICLD